MGGFYGSGQIRSEDRDSVRSALEQLARKKRRFLLGPALEGWIGVDPGDPGQGFRVARALARRFPGELIAMLVDDDDRSAFEYDRDGRRIDQYDPIPDDPRRRIGPTARRMASGGRVGRTVATWREEFVSDLGRVRSATDFLLISAQGVDHVPSQYHRPRPRARDAVGFAHSGILQQALEVGVLADEGFERHGGQAVSLGAEQLDADLAIGFGHKPGATEPLVDYGPVRRPSRIDMGSNHVLSPAILSNPGRFVFRFVLVDEEVDLPDLVHGQTGRPDAVNRLERGLAFERRAHVNKRKHIRSSE
jgi:hypothetical protein